MNYGYDQLVRMGQAWMNVFLKEQIELSHYGVKGMKWGIHNGPPYPIDRKALANNKERDRITLSGHRPPESTGKPNSIVDHVDDTGKVKARVFYDDAGRKTQEIDTTDHGNPKKHPYGEHGEHVHEYTWSDDAKQPVRTTRNLSAEEREENGDII